MRTHSLAHDTFLVIIPLSHWVGVFLSASGGAHIRLLIYFRCIFCRVPSPIQRHEPVPRCFRWSAYKGGPRHWGHRPCGQVRGTGTRAARPIDTAFIHTLTHLSGAPHVQHSQLAHCRLWGTCTPSTPAAPACATVSHLCCLSGTL